MSDKNNRLLSKLLIFLHILIALFIISDLIQTEEKVITGLIGPYPVTYVIDGDTIVIKRQLEQIHVRLIGIDTPERDEAYTSQARDYLKLLIADHDLYLLVGQESYDRYGRTLAYVFLDDQTTMLNREMLRAGWAELMIIPPNDRYELEFYQLNQRAIIQRIGVYQKK